jgi:hypothetical protein
MREICTSGSVGAPRAQALGATRKGPCRPPRWALPLAVRIRLFVRGRVRWPAGAKRPEGAAKRGRIFLMKGVNWRWSEMASGTAKRGPQGGPL